jgi:hypothetical protein
MYISIKTFIRSKHRVVKNQISRSLVHVKNLGLLFFSIVFGLQ